MATDRLLARDPATETSRGILERVLAGYGPRDFAVRFWGGETWGADAGRVPAFTLVLNHAGALRRMFWPPDGLAFGEAFAYGDFDIEGDTLAFMRLCRHLRDARHPPLRALGLVRELFRLPKLALPRAGHAPARLSGGKHSPARDREAVGYAYDTSNEFYALWLDADLLYTCAYFAAPGDTLEAAQRAKLDLVCRKLRLKPGERFLDIGCGWGALVVHAARHYGAQAVGVTLSRKQAELGAERVRAAGLGERCRVEYRDYRELAGLGAFDKIASVGMIEHLGAAMLPAYFRKAFESLRPGGAFLNHAISRPANRPELRWRKFARKYVFPDGQLEPISVALGAAEAAGFEVRDVESLREHYALTLGHWLGRLEARHAEAVALVGESTYRVFRLYLAGAQDGMTQGVYNLHQALLVKPDAGRSGLPLTRADWYA